MEEERTNNKILDEQSDELRNRRNALDAVRDVDDLAIYPEEMFEPGHLSEKGDESLTAFIEKCDRQKIAEISRMVNRDDILEDENCIEENSPAHEEQKNTTVSQAPERGGLKL